MVNPKAVTNFSRTREELEEFILFSIVVAGKNAFVQAQKLDEFLKPRLENDFSPFHYIQELDQQGKLIERLRAVKMGQYERISVAFRGVSHFFYDRTFASSHPLGVTPYLQCINMSYLEVIKGVGMKTARFFMMHSRPNQWYACLDTHILKWLGERGHDVPKTTPNGQRYLKLEQIFLGYCMVMKKTPAELDLAIWNERH